MNSISKYVENKLSESVYQKLSNLKKIKFRYGEVEFFSKESIGIKQEGYRYNPISKEINEDWPDDNFVVIGIDNSVGDGGEPIIIKTDDDNLPIYHFENLDWNYPEKIADSLDDYIVINNEIARYSYDIENNNLNETDFNNLIDTIKKINNSNYWDDFLTNAIIK